MKHTLLDALREATEIASGVPGATNGTGYVEIEEDPVIPTRPYAYIPDMDSPHYQRTGEVWHLEEEQLERLVLFAEQAVWEPTDNFLITPPGSISGDWIL